MIYGTNDIFFNASWGGDPSVALPEITIGRAEILDEPGAAGYTEGNSGAALDAGGAMTTIGSLSITVPEAGHVLVIATGQVQALGATSLNN